MKILIILCWTIFASVNADEELALNALRGRRAPIFFGHNAKISQHPYFVAIECYRVATSGGSIISPKFVVTAAHVFDLIKDKDYYRLRSGADERGRGGNEFYIWSYEIHPEYVKDDGAGGCANDIALIQIEGTFTFDKLQRPIKMFNTGEVAKADTKAVVIGLGWTQDGIADRLKMVQIPIVEKSQCNETWFNNDGIPIPNSAICAGGGRDRKDSCDGDSGGALIINGRLAGILSFGYSRRKADRRVECGFEGVPSIYTEVAQFRDWIDSRINW